MELVKGHRYRCPVHLHFPETLVSDEKIAGLLRAKGFMDVEVVGSGGERFCRGTWEWETQDVMLPEEINEAEAKDIT